MDLIELRALAFGGDPASARQAGQRLSGAAAALEQVSVSLERAAGRIGLGWQGQAAAAARTGVAGHSDWARTAAARVAAAGGSASAHAASADYVRANMPDPGVGGADLARAEEAQRNAQLRAVELLEGHAAKTAAQRPSGALEAPPGAATTGTARAAAPAGTARSAAAARGSAGEAARAARPAGRLAAPGSADGGPSAARPFAGARRVPMTVGLPSGEAAGGTSGAAARGAVLSSRDVGSALGPGVAGYRTQAPPEAGGSDPALFAPGSGRRGAPGTDPRHRWTNGVRHGREPGATEAAARGGEAAALPARHGTGADRTTGQAGAGSSGGVRGPDGPGSPGGLDSRGGHRTVESAAPGIGMPTAIGGPIDDGRSRPLHRRLGFLIDEDCAFDGRPDDGWASPPVIGA
jgi:hypothetical protein